MLDVIIMILVGISGICWSIVYMDSIRTGFRQKTYCMPLFALGLNIAWEGIYSFTDLFIRHSYGVQAIANACWFLLDIFIVVTWFKFGREECKDEVSKKWFVPWTILVLVSCFVLQILFMQEFGSLEGEKYSAFLQNIIMSVAICKCIGTLTPTIFGTIEGNTFIFVTGVICFIFDVIYIYFLNLVRKKEQKTA